ncbi:cephalotocin receptor 1-like [Ostrea edulis]|uniref:cephalotocin receptor 1-like n=1 Tax=Ostrea edulis TaxID=37623 RepID=UPI0024AF1F08|nr:cephalotocin receptor 1-like [Ostrea edulis]
MNGTPTALYSLERWNDEFSEKYLANTILIVFGLLLGIPGNLLVIVIYSCRLIKEGTGRFFVLPLAYVDLTGLFITGTLNLIRNTKHVIFPGNVTCKLLLYGSYVVGCSSLFLLNVIAVQRYQKICRPFSRQMNMKYLRVSLIICIAFSLLLNIPSLFYYGTAPVFDSYSGNVTGVMCQKVYPSSTVGLRAYQGAGAVISTANVICITTLYILIARTIFRTTRLRKTRQNDYVDEQQSSAFTSNTTVQDAQSESDEVQAMSKSRKGSVQRLSIMFMVISFTAIASYFPSWIFIAIETYKSNFWKEMSEPLFQICVILRRMYILNHLSNPFIYGMYDFAFRQQIQRLFCSFK